MGFGTIPRFWASQKIGGADLSINSGSQEESLAFGNLTTGAVTEQLVRSPTSGYMAGAGFASSGGAGLSGTNYVNFSIVNKGPSGAGTTQLLATTPTFINSNHSGGGNAGAPIVAYQPFVFTTAGLPAASVNAGDILAVNITITGTVALPESIMWLVFLPTS
jgi:hypothetical protein